MTASLEHKRSRRFDWSDNIILVPLKGYSLKYISSDTNCDNGGFSSGWWQAWVQPPQCTALPFRTENKCRRLKGNNSSHYPQMSQPTGQVLVYCVSVGTSYWDIGIDQWHCLRPANLHVIQFFLIQTWQARSLLYALCIVAKNKRGKEHETLKFVDDNHWP